MTKREAVRFFSWCCFYLASQFVATYWDATNNVELNLTQLNSDLVPELHHSDQELKITLFQMLYYSFSFKKHKKLSHLFSAAPFG